MPIWNDLLDQCTYRDVFMTHAWATAWWTHFGQGCRLCIDVVYEDDTPIGLAPLMVSRETYGGLPARVLGFMTNNHTSRSAFVIPRRRASVLRALAAHWRLRAQEWDVLRLLHLPRRCEQIMDLVAALRAEKLMVFGPDPSNTLFYVKTSTSFGDYLAAQDRKFRRNLNHARNGLSKAGHITYEVVSDVTEIDLAMARFFAIDEHSHKRGIEHAIYTQNEKDFCVSLCCELNRAASTGFELWIQKLDGRPICGLLVLLYEAKSLLLVTYYDERWRAVQPGRNLFATVVENHCNGDRIKEIDFNGNSTYVQTWASYSDVFEGLSACNLRPYSLLLGGSKTLKRAVLRQKSRFVAGFKGSRAAAAEAPGQPRPGQMAGG